MGDPTQAELAKMVLDKLNTAVERVRDTVFSGGKLRTTDAIAYVMALLDVVYGLMDGIINNGSEMGEPAERLMQDIAKFLIAARAELVYTAEAAPPSDPEPGPMLH